MLSLLYVLSIAMIAISHGRLDENEKFLCDGDGVPLLRYSSGTSPLAAEGKIRELLGFKEAETESAPVV